VIADVWLLSLSLILLWLPRRWLRLGPNFVAKANPRPSRRKRINREPGDDSLRLRDDTKKPRNWLDLTRGCVGAFIVQHVCLREPFDGTPNVGGWIFALQCAIFVAALLIQMHRPEDRLTLTAPVFFIGGLCVGVLGWLPGLFAVVAICVTNLVLPGPTVFLLLFSALLGMFGLLLSSGPWWEIALAAGLSLLPVIVSLMAERKLMQLGQRAKSTERHP
jgi:hypothetical protein